ncbi:MAG: hypothetical protein IPM71_01900 [Bacteroidota bacterium]|nr:MAG: hypothetical protein IPM71_01900 [Bacteroidota bacterium]
MKHLQIHTRLDRQEAQSIEVSISGLSCLTIQNTETFVPMLLSMVAQPNTNLYLSVRNIRFIDSKGFDCLNLLSSVAERSNSTFSLIDVEPNLMDLIKMVKQYSIWHLKNVFPLEQEPNVA